MNESAAACPFRSLLRSTLLSLPVCVVLVALCYFWVDRPVAFFVHDHAVNHLAILKWLTLPPPILQAWAPVVLAALVIRRAWGPFRRWEQALFAAGIALILADQFKESADFVFGRYWPDTWIHDNPSLIQNNAYGFHAGQGGASNGWYDSFPSGHTTRVLAVVAVYWVGYPSWRPLAVLAAVAIAAGLVGMNYHFVGDVVAGGFLGAWVGMWAAHFAALSPSALGERGQG